MNALGTYQCLTCGNDFTASVRKRERGLAKYCSCHCANKKAAQKRWVRKRQESLPGRLALVRGWSVYGYDETDVRD